MPGGAPHVRREVVSCAEQATLWPKLNGGANRRPPLATVITTRQRRARFPFLQLRHGKKLFMIARH
jgi:hypothetical protein